LATVEQQPVLANLFELYIYDFSEFLPVRLDESGRFGYPDLHSYWQDPDRHPFLFRVDGQLAGFALVKKAPHVGGETLVWDIAEFFVPRVRRRAGIGTAFAHRVWRELPGAWQVRVMQSNRAADQFWRSAVSGFTGQAIAPATFKKDESLWHLFSFNLQRFRLNKILSSAPP
jgi:predicted acetyltransferase